MGDELPTNYFFQFIVALASIFKKMKFTVGLSPSKKIVLFDSIKALQKSYEIAFRTLFLCGLYFVQRGFT